MKISCTYYENYRGYVCQVSRQDIVRTEDYETVGAHLKGRRNEDVNTILFLNCKITGLPVGLERHFPLFDSIAIMSSTVIYIDKNDFNKHATLREISFVKNCMSFLPGDLITGNPMLQAFEFRNNGKAVIGPTIINDLSKLESIWYKSLQWKKSKSVKVKPNFNDIRSEIFDDFNKSPWKIILKDKRKQDVKAPFYDFEISIGDEVFQAHKAVLMAHSPFFANIFENHQDLEELTLKDISPKTFEEILKFMSTGQTPQAEDVNFEELLVASEKLKMKALAKHAADKLMDKVTILNAFKLLSLSNKYEHYDLRLKCHKILASD